MFEGGGGGADFTFLFCLFYPNRSCGPPGVPVCVDPSWDGIHMTQHAYSWIARWLIDDTLPKLNCQV